MSTSSSAVQTTVPALEDTFESFAIVKKNRNAAIFWLLQLAQRCERDWADEPLRLH